MDDLVQFLRDRLNEDEAVARRVKSSWRQIGETGVIVASDGDRAEECANGNWTGIAEHIVRHDPARVLREVEAKRQLLDGHTPDYHWCPMGDNVLKVLALPHADHPDYRDEWRP
ncbi:DUF6221 family protein [Streptomyces sp. NBC_01108]|uniref:DUF6221 family protein n=1 Tax=Streptomyces sp. NBC_01108 TaxID=2903751 RepID=UPI003872DA68|nr:DUF6221 family protein [Streptomyces sp. NBC_01108]